MNKSATAFQMYFKSPYELDTPPPTLGYKILYNEKHRERSIIFIGESASDPEVLANIFFERNRLEIVFIPITEQFSSRGLQHIQEFSMHSSLRNLALVERLVPEGTKIVPLHQGLWYFQITPEDIVKARKSLLKLGKGALVRLPFVEITQEMQSVKLQANPSFSQKMYLGKIFFTIRKRWRQYKKISKSFQNI